MAICRERPHECQPNPDPLGGGEASCSCFCSQKSLGKDPTLVKMFNLRPHYCCLFKIILRRGCNSKTRAKLIWMLAQVGFHRPFLTSSLYGHEFKSDIVVSNDLRRYESQSEVSWKGKRCCSLVPFPQQLSFRLWENFKLRVARSVNEMCRNYDVSIKDLHANADNSALENFHKDPGRFGNGRAAINIVSTHNPLSDLFGSVQLFAFVGDHFYITG